MSSTKWRCFDVVLKNVCVWLMQVCQSGSKLHHFKQTELALNMWPETVPVTKEDYLVLPHTSL